MNKTCQILTAQFSFGSGSKAHELRQTGFNFGGDYEVRN